MGEDIGAAQLAQGSDADRGAQVVGEDEEGRTEGEEAAVGSEAVDDGAHGVFTHPEGDVGTVVAPAALFRPLQAGDFHQR